MSSAPIALEVAAAPADVAARPRRPVRHSWWVVGGLGVVALLAFQFIEELAELKAFGQRYLSSGSAPHAVVARQRDAPRPPPPPRAPSEAPRKSRASEGGAPGAPSAGDADGGCSSRGGADADTGEGRVGGVASTRAPARDRRGADGRARGDGSWRGRARRSGGRRGGGAERRRRGSGSGSVFVGRWSSRRRIRSLGRRRRSVGGGRGNGRTESAAVVRNARVGGVAAPQSAAAGVDSLL